MIHKAALLTPQALALATAACGGALQTVADASPTAISGEEIFQRQGCSECHVEGAGDAAPSLRGLYGFEVTLDGGETVVADEASHREVILSSAAMTVLSTPSIMPNFQSRMTEDQLEALIEFVRTIPE